MLLEEAPPPIPPAPLETPPPGKFSVTQLQKLMNQLSVIAPEGFMLARNFVDTLYGFTDNAVSEDSPLLGAMYDSIPSSSVVNSFFPTTGMELPKKQ